MARAGGSDPYAIDYSNQLDGMDVKNEEEAMSEGNNLGQ
jgi:hypothetical protein